MSVRDLQTKTIKTEEASEFNILRVVNLDEFLLSYQNTSSYYEPPFKILADLEGQIKFQNVPEKTILCSYKPGGDIIFDLVEVKEEYKLRIVAYRYKGSVS